MYLVRVDNGNTTKVSLDVFHIFGRDHNVPCELVGHFVGGSSVSGRLRDRGPKLAGF
jgi:hypothetical protein